MIESNIIFDKQEIVRDIQKKINSGDVYTFKKINTTEDDDGLETSQLHEHSDADIQGLIRDSRINESTEAAGFKIHYSSDKKSILRIESINDYPHNFIPFRYKADKVAVFYYLHSYIKTELEKDISTDFFQDSEFEVLLKKMKSKMDNESYELKAEMSPFIQRDKLNKKLFFFDGIFVDLVLAIEARLQNDRNIKDDEHE